MVCGDAHTPAKSMYFASFRMCSGRLRIWKKMGQMLLLPLLYGLNPSCDVLWLLHTDSGSCSIEYGDSTVKVQ
jgi:hypothetical protein